jgi:hypothetical protein
MATIHFFTRTISKDKNILVPIYVRLKYGRQIDLCCKADLLIKADNWSNETQQARQRADIFRHKSGETEKSGRKRFNDRITGLRTFIEGELSEAHQADVNNEWLKTVIDKYWYPEKYKVNLFSFIQSFIDKSLTKPNPKTGRPVCSKMRYEYGRTFYYLKEYATSIGHVIDFKNINLEFYDGFIQFLQGKKLSTNTCGKKIQTLKNQMVTAMD